MMLLKNQALGKFSMPKLNIQTIKVVKTKLNQQLHL